jgi:hypothetical protein
MHHSQSPPSAQQEWLIPEARDLDDATKQRVRIQPVKPSIRSSGLNHAQSANQRQSVLRRIFRSVTRFFVAVIIGVGGTLAWQSHGDEASEMLAARAPTLAWMLSLSTTRAPAAATTVRTLCNS